VISWENNSTASNTSETPFAVCAAVV